LIAEDNEPTRRRVIEEISSDISEIEFLQAATFEEAEKLIREAHADGIEIRVAILDSQMPRAGALVISMDLCNIVSAKFPDVLVIHCTAFAGDPTVEKHVQERHSARRVHEFFPKTGNWIEALVSELVRDKVERELNSFFSVGRGVAHPMFRQRGATFDLADLTQDIARYWSRLPEETRARILNDFDVDESNPTRIVVSLGGRDGD